MKKVLKIKYVGLYEDFDENDNIFSKILSKRYDIRFSENPEWIICSVYGTPYAYTQYDCPRILYCGENLIPDFKSQVSRLWQYLHLRVHPCINITNLIPGPSTAPNVSIECILPIKSSIFSAPVSVLL